MHAERRRAHVDFSIEEKSRVPLKRKTDRRMNAQSVTSQVIEIGLIGIADRCGVGHDSTGTEQTGRGDGIATNFIDRNNTWALAP